MKCARRKPHYYNNAGSSADTPNLYTPVYTIGTHSIATYTTDDTQLSSNAVTSHNIALIRFGMGGYEVLGIFIHKILRSLVKFTCKWWVSAMNYMNYMKNIPYNIYTTSLRGVGEYVCVGIIGINMYVILSNLTHKWLWGVAD